MSAPHLNSEHDLLFSELLERLRNGDECHNIEAKKASAIDKSVLETVCAFANEPGMGGGYLLLGVVRDDEQLFPDYEVLGITDPDKIQGDLASQCADQFNVAVRPRIMTVLSGSKTALLVEVPEAQASEKPVYFKAKGLPKGAFRRIGSSDQTCTEDDLSLLYQGRGYKAFEDTILEDCSVSQDFSEEAIQQYRLRRERANRTAVELTWEQDELLYALGAVTRQKNGVFVPTIAGLLCFGKDSALRRIMPLVRVDYIRIAGKEWVENPDSRFETVEMRGPLLSLIPRVITIVLDDLPRSFSLEDGIHRQDKPLVPETVIREAVVNSLMHRNYRTKQAIQIIRYSNRLEIRNPGCSLKPDDQLGEAGSINRNEKIAAILHECNLAETKGSGIRVMQDLMERSNLSFPLFESNRDSDSFTLTLLTHHLMDESDIAWLAKFKDYHLGADDAKALVFLKEVGIINNFVYRDICKVDTLHASVALRRLREADILVQKGKGTATYYLPGPVFNQSKDTTALSPKLDPLSPKLAPLSPKLDDFPEEIQKQARELGKRANPEQTKALIISLCVQMPLSKRDIANLVSRSEVTIGDLLREILETGQLGLQYPDVPNHPQQKYLAREDRS